MKFVTRNLHSFPPYLDYVATLPWEVNSPNLLKNYKRYNSKIVQYVITSEGSKPSNTNTPVARPLISFTEYRITIYSNRVLSN